MDQYYSMTLGRPLGISGIGDCPPANPMGTNPTMHRLEDYINNFTILTRQILSSDDLTNNKIDDFTDRLLQLHETLPTTIHFDGTWLDPKKDIPEWPLEVHAAIIFSKIHNYLIILNRKRQENSCRSSGDGPRNTIINQSTAEERRSHRGYARVISSCRETLLAFEYISIRVRAGLMCWILGQQAFNAGMILSMNMWETGDFGDFDIVNRAYETFVEMREKGVHDLAGLAAAQLGELLKFNHQPTEKIMGHSGMILLEDPGLQGFLPGNYEPFSFRMAGSDLPSPVTSAHGPVRATRAAPSVLGKRHRRTPSKSVAVSEPAIQESYLCSSDLNLNRENLIGNSMQSYQHGASDFAWSSPTTNLF